MTPEQKKRAENLLALRHANRGTDLARYQQGVIALLQELIDAPEQAGVPDGEPVAAQVRYMAVKAGLPSYGNSKFGPWQPVKMPKEGDLLKGVDSVGYAYEIRLLYAAPQAPAVSRDGIPNNVRKEIKAIH